MKRRLNVLLYTLITVLLYTLSISCQKDDLKDIAVLATNDVSNITQTTVTTGGNISNDGGALITTRGVCWSEDENPTINNNKTMNAAGRGNFTSSITNLTPNTTYYVRAYATNSVGISYGNELTFKTLEELNSSTIVTTQASEITQETASSGGNITITSDTQITARGVCWSTKEAPSIEDSKTEDGEGEGGFTSYITKLEPNTIYYVRAYATNSAGIFYGSEITFTTKSYNTKLVDADGNIYPIITIGKQTWMAENLKTTKYNDDIAIPHVTEDKIWTALTSPSYCIYNNNESFCDETYGALYNWYTVNSGKLCPKGWHVPTDKEWTTLAAFLGGNFVAGGILKENGCDHWKSPNKGSSNEFYFTALPGGLREIDGTFQNKNISSHWWSSTEFSNKNAWVRDIFYVEPFMTRYDSNKQLGLSVRCIKD